jgi:putative membrane protein
MNTTTSVAQQDKKFLPIIIGLSIAIPVVVAILLFMPSRLDLAREWVMLLPHLNAIINSTTAILLIAAVVFIKQGKVQLHQYTMTSAFTLGALFLVSYVVYHASVESTIFGDTNGNGLLEETEKATIGATRSVYLFVLFSHILLSIVVVPFVLLAMYYAYSKQFVKHKKMTKFAFPVWLYVSVTGVIVYLMISPYYQ